MSPFGRFFYNTYRSLQNKWLDGYAQKHKLNCLNLGVIRDQHHPQLVAKVEYQKDNQVICSDTAGLYQFQNVFVHRKTGLGLIRGHASDWPIALRESGPDDYGRLLVRSKLIRSINTIDQKTSEILDSDTPLFVFNLFQDKSNYWHFVVDSLSRLTLLLAIVQTPIQVAHFCERSSFIGQYFGLLEDLFDCTFLQLSRRGSKHIWIRSPVLFLEDTFQRTYNSVDYYANLLDRFKKDPQLSALSLSPEDFRETHKTPTACRTHLFDWMLDKSFVNVKTKKIYKSGGVWFKHSRTALDSVFSVGERLATSQNGGNLSRPEFILSVRDSSTKKRTLSNTEDLLKTFPQVQALDFTQLTVKDQILSCYHCQILIGVLGAGLANAIFLRPNSMVVEIFPLGYTIPPASFVEDLCASRGIIFRRIFSSALDSSSSTSSGSTRLDPDKLADALGAHQPILVCRT